MTYAAVGSWNFERAISVATGAGKFADGKLSVDLLPEREFVSVGGGGR